MTAFQILVLACLNTQLSQSAFAVVQPLITQQPQDASVPSNSSATFEVSAISQDGGGLKYQWQVSKDNQETWENIVGAVSSAYTTPIVNMSNDGYIYRVKVTSTLSTPTIPRIRTSQTAYLTVIPYLDTPSTPNASATSGVLKSLFVSWSAITNASSYTLKLYNSSNAHLATIVGLSGTSRTINIADYGALADNTAYKVSITAIGDGSNYLSSSESSKADVTTNAAPVTPTITSQPGNASVIYNSNTTFSVTATTTDSGILNYQWQVNAGSSWSDIAGATNSSYTTPTLSMSANGYQYRVNITNSKNGGTSAAVTSNTATLTVSGPSISSFTPLTIKSGDYVTISGNGFSNVVSVKFGNVQATNIQVKNATQIQVQAPSNIPTSGFINVTTSEGLSSTSSKQYTLSQTVATVVKSPCPTPIPSPTPGLSLSVSGCQTFQSPVPIIGQPTISGTLKQTNAGIDTFTITGSNLANPSLVTVNGIKLKVQSASSSVIVGVVQSISPGSFTIIVTVSGFLATFTKS